MAWRLPVDSLPLFSLTRLMKDKPFHKPVVVSPRFGHLRQIRTVAEAGRVLLHEWPEGLNPKKNNQAAKIIIETLRGNRKPSEARKALIDAAQAAGILIDDGQNDGHQIAAE